MTRRRPVNVLPVTTRSLTRMIGLALALLLLLGAPLATPVMAQGDAATVRLDGRAVFQVGPGTEAGDAQERARRIEQRIGGLLRNLNALGPPVASQTAEGVTVTVSGVPVVTVTPRDAEDNLTPAPALAQQWATALGQATGAGKNRANAGSKIVPRPKPE